MTCDARGELFAALVDLSLRYPHWRVGQLVANVAGWADADLWDAEDDQLLTAVRTHLATSPATTSTTAGRPEVMLGEPANGPV